MDNPEGSWEYIIDERSGEILSKKDTIKREPRIPLPNVAPAPKPSPEDSSRPPQRETESAPEREQEVSIRRAKPISPQKSLTAPAETLPVVPLPTENISGTTTIICRIRPRLPVIGAGGAQAAEQMLSRVPATIQTICNHG